MPPTVGSPAAVAGPGPSMPLGRHSGAYPPRPANPPPPGGYPPPPLPPPGYARSGYPPPGYPSPYGPGPDGPRPGPPQMPRPESLLLPNRPDVRESPASWGWRGRLRRMSGGVIRTAPSEDEQRDRQARLDIQRSFSRPMTIVVVQPKGGAGKTPTTIGLASALGAHRGGYVIGWDDNETRGTLAVRVKNLHDQRSTAWDLLGELPKFERADARVGDLAHYVRGQGEAQFDALVSDDSPGNMAQIGEQEFRRIHAVLQRFYRMIVIDTGNNVRSPNWQSAVNAADLVVVVSTYRRDVGYSGSWVLDHLSQTGREALAAGAVTMLSAADPTTDPGVRRELVEHFSTRTHAVVEIPYDPLIALGGVMEWPRLSEPTRRAWTRAGAAVVNALGRQDRH